MSDDGTVRPRVFLDVESTGLDPAVHQVWEIAYAIDDGPVLSSFVPHSLSGADPFALKVGGYEDRYRPVSFDVSWPFERDARVALSGATLVGANPAFDASFLRARWGVAPWHYRLLDVESYAMPILGYDQPQGLATIVADLRKAGANIPVPDHTAAGDVAAVRAAFRSLRELAKYPVRWVTGAGEGT